MTSKSKAVSDGYHTITPHLVVKGAAEAIEFYQQAFGATEKTRLADDKGQIVCAELLIGDSLLSVADEAPEWNIFGPQALGNSPVVMALHVPDADAVWQQALAAGAKEVFPLADQFYGERSGRLADPFGHLWIVSTQIEEVAPDEMKRRLDEWTKQAQSA